MEIVKNVDNMICESAGNRFVSHSEGQTRGFAAEFCASLAGGDMITLQGELGAGKTTFVQSLLETLGAVGPFTSPTFLIMKEYSLSQGTVGYQQGISHVYHIDAYRITGEDMIELGWSDMIDRKDALFIIEWPQMIASILPSLQHPSSFSGKLRQVSLDHVDEKTRSIEVR